MTKIKKELVYLEPCDCGEKILHNNGGNYHKKVYRYYNDKEETVCYRVTTTRERIGNFDGDMLLIIGTNSNAPNKVFAEKGDTAKEGNIDSEIYSEPIKKYDELYFSFSELNEEVLDLVPELKEAK